MPKKAKKEFQEIKEAFNPEEKFSSILEPETKKEKKPNSLGIKIIGGICFFAAIVYFLTGIILLYNKDLLSPLPNFNFTAGFEGVYYVISAVVFIFAVIYAIIGYGLLKRKRSAALALIIICLLNVLASLVSVIQGNFVSLLNLSFNLIIGGYVFYALRKSKASQIS